MRYFDFGSNIFEELLLELQTLIIRDEYSEDTIQEFHKALQLTKELQVLIDRIGALDSGEESEDTFHELLAEYIEELEEEDSYLQELRF